MSRFGGSRSLFDGGDDGGDMFKGGDLLSEGFEEPTAVDRDLLSEDVEGESLSKTDLISQEEGPEDEGEGMTSFTSNIAQEDEGNEPEDDPSTQGFTSNIAQEPEDEGEDPGVQQLTAMGDEGGEDEGDGPQAFTTRTSNLAQEEEGPPDEEEGELSALGSFEDVSSPELAQFDSDSLSMDEDLDLVGPDDGVELEMEGFDF